MKKEVGYGGLILGLNIGESLVLKKDELFVVIGFQETCGASRIKVVVNAPKDVRVERSGYRKKAPDA